MGVVFCTVTAARGWEQGRNRQPGPRPVTPAVLLQGHPGLIVNKRAGAWKPPEEADPGFSSGLVMDTFH